MDPSLAQKLHQVIQPVHSFIYFAPEPALGYAELGYAVDGGYFAGRGAALGPVSAEVIAATFFNFCPDKVIAGTPPDWTRADTEAIQQARYRAVGAALERLASGVLSAAEVAEASDLCQQVCDGIGYEGKPLAAGNRAAVLPEDPLVRMWQLLAVVREWRGDAHVAVLSSEPLTALEALVLEGNRSLPVALLKLTRGWPDDAWDRTVARFAARGLATDDGELTDAGTQLRAAIEERTDRASLPLWETIGEQASTRLHDLLLPLRTAILENGGFGSRRS
ncbi:MAG: hypothetical protein M3Z46_05255 [Actinomycetota bacterium]|nr:hypothetical protein [Actinomycetota bacterium]